MNLPEAHKSGVCSHADMPPGGHWSRFRIKYLLKEIDHRTTTGKEPLLSMRQGKGLIPHNDVSNKRFKNEDLVGYKIVAPGQLVMNRMRASIGLFAASHEHGLASPDYAVFQSLQQIDLDYLMHLFRTPSMGATFRRESKGMGTGHSGFLRLYTDRFGAIPISIPPFEIQNQIVNFIKAFDRKIFKLIRNKRRLIELLKEHKQNIINQAMTRGLDPNVKLKPSGVGWIGDIPEHWEVKRLKWVTRLQRGYDLPQQKRVPGSYPVVSSGGVIDTHYDYRAKSPGVVIGRYGSTEAVFFIEQDFWPHNTSLFVTDFQENDPRWCYYLLGTISKADHAGKSAVPGIDRKDLFDIRVPEPSLAEQRDIVWQIEQESKVFEDTIARTTREIDLIREYRTRLISDVVTGQVDVCHIALPEIAEEDLTPLDEDDADAEDLLDETLETEDAV